MKVSIALWFACAALLATASHSVAAEVKTYQVTGTVLEVSDSMIVVQKGEEKWQLARNKQTKGKDAKVGDKVTIEYRMVATDIEVKEAKKK